jgi:ankyrin repeat protein
MSKFKYLMPLFILLVVCTRFAYADAIHEAAARGDTQKLASLLEQKKIINRIDRNGRTPLFHAIYNGKQSTAKFLIREGANLNIVDRYGYNALAIAAVQGEKELFFYAVKKGGNLRLVTRAGKTLLHRVAEIGSKSSRHKESEKLLIAKHLIKKGVPIDGNHKSGLTPLHIALMSRFQNLTQAFIRNGANIQATFSDKNHSKNTTPLHLTAERKLPQMALHLIRRKARVNARNINQATPLHVAAGYGAYQTAKILIQHGADVNAVDRQGNTPLHEIAGHWRQEKGHLDTARLLIANKANVNALNQDGRTPYYLARKNSRKMVAAYLKPMTNTRLVSLHDAAEDGNLSMIKILLADGKNINHLDVMGNTPLNRALMNKNIDLAKFLISQGADLNAGNNSGQTPFGLAIRHADPDLIKQMLNEGVKLDPVLLNTAVRAKNVEIVSLLIKKRLNVNVQDPKSGWTPLHYAALVDSYEIAALLLKHGAKTGVPSQKERTPLDIAIQKNHLQLASLIKAYRMEASERLAQEKAAQKKTTTKKILKPKKAPQPGPSYSSGGK